MLSQNTWYITQRIKLISHHGQGLNILKFTSSQSLLSSAKVRVVLNQNPQMPKTQITIGIVHNPITTCYRKNKDFITAKSNLTLFCDLELIHFYEYEWIMLFLHCQFLTFFLPQVVVHLSSTFEIQNKWTIFSKESVFVGRWCKRAPSIGYEVYDWWCVRCGVLNQWIKGKSIDMRLLSEIMYTHKYTLK